MSYSLSVAVVIESLHHGNTRRVAETIGASLGASVLTAEECRREELADFDLVGFGSGIYFGRHHYRLRVLAKDCPAIPRHVFLFSTAGISSFQSWWHGSLRRILMRRGCHILGEFCCRGWDTVGPLALVGGLNRHHPNFDDLTKAKVFAQRIQEQYAIWSPTVSMPLPDNNERHAGQPLKGQK